MYLLGIKNDKNNCKSIDFFEVPFLKCIFVRFQKDFFVSKESHANPYDKKKDDSFK